MKKIILLTSFLLFYTSIKSQNLEFFTDFNIGLVSHQPLKKFHNDLVNEIPFNNIEATDIFKYNYGFTVGLKVKSINTSFFFSNRVSGAKSSTSDFSGLIRVTNELKGFSFGGIYEQEIKKFTKGNLYLGFKGNITLSKFNLESETRISSLNLDSFNFNSTDFGAGTLIIYKYPIGFMFLRAFIGVDIYFGGKLKFKEIEDAHLTFNNGNKVTTGWSGVNTGIGLSIPL